MEVSFGITGAGYTLFASDTSAARSIVRMKSTEDKQKQIGDHLVMAYSGEPGDTVQFAEFVERNLRLYQIRNHIPLRPEAAAAWTRTQLAKSLRSRKPYSVNLLLGGYDPTASRAELYWLDYLGTLSAVPYAAHGYGAYFSLSTMDRYHRPDMNLDEGMDLLRRCVDELEKRFIVNLGDFTVRVVDKDGVRKVDLKTGNTTTAAPAQPEQQPPQQQQQQQAPVVAVQ